ncbi:MAG: amino acid adenylation domain-containing protein, partial [Candidatus Eremiobacteraeota bacterium]|nr:amino acid adenylation domain-containing protein [Candidatus Eremiobacteraeota bacterium]
MSVSPGVHAEDEIGPRPAGAAAPLSFGQELLWLVDRATPGTTVWNVSRPFRLRGPLDVAALQRAFDGLAARHEALRTVFVAGSDGPRQVVRPPGSVPIEHVDLSHLTPVEGVREADRLATLAEGTPFDLSRDVPLRVLLVRLASDDRLLCVTTHHIVSDGWSKNVMFRDLSALYESALTGRNAGLPDLPIQFGDYAAWERGDAHAAELAEGLAFWRDELGGSPPSLALPLDKPRPASAGFAARRSVVVLPHALLNDVTRRAREHGVTTYMLLLAAYVSLLHRHSGQDDVIVGSPIVGRAQSETENLIGFFANTLVLRTRLDDDPTFATLLGRVRETCLDAYDHQDVPVEKLIFELQKDRELSLAPLFNVILTMEDVLPDNLAFEGVDVEPLERDRRATKFDLTLLASSHPDGLRLTLWYRTELFAQETADRLLAHLRCLLEGATRDPSLRISELPLTTKAERDLTLARSAGPDLSETLEPVYRRFEAAALRTPQATAVCCGDESLTYAELDARAGALARHLCELGVGTGVTVGLALDRSIDAVVGLMGILKAGGAYVPLPPDSPPERLREQMAQSATRILLTTSAEPAAFAAPEVRIVHIDALPPRILASGDVVPARAGLADLAYVLFRSGSSGVPKGVAVTHANLASYERAIAHRLDLPAARSFSFAAVSSLAVDHGNTAIFPALCSGGTLHVVPSHVARDAAAFAEWMRAHPIDVLKIAPTHFEALLGRTDRCPLPSQWLVVGGESCSWELVERVRRVGRCRILNHYGPTETTVGACAFEVRDLESAAARPPAVPIGTPLPGTFAYVLDARGELVPDGVPGELSLGGAGVARGYVGRPDLTDERFSRDRFRTQPDARLYRTGDRVRRLPGGELEFLGRFDDQVKIRGYRVELGEIEAALLQNPSVVRSAVVYRAAGAGDSRLLAYVVLAGEERGETLSGLRANLAERLPDYMIPSAIVALDRFPLTRAGKIDRNALP